MSAPLVGLALAFTLVAAGCNERTYVDDAVGFETFPSTNEALPLNGRVVFVRRVAEVAPTPEGLTFVQRPDDVELAHEVVGGGVAARTEAFVVQPQVRAEDELRLVIEPNPALVERIWAVAAEDVTPPLLDDGPVDFGGSRAFGIGDDAGIEVAMAGQATADGDHYMLRLAGDVDALLLPFVDIEAEGGAQHFLLRVPGLERRRLCVDISAVDAAGNERSLADGVCVDVAP